MQGFSLTSNQLSEIWSGLHNPPTLNTIKTLKSVELPPFCTDDRKMFTGKLKANIDNVWVGDELSARISDPVVSGKWKLAIKDSLELKF